MKATIVTGVVNLIKVKSIVTILLSAVFSVLALKGTITGEQFLTIFSVVIAFYFGTQSQKNAAAATNTAANTEKELKV